MQLDRANGETAGKLLDGMDRLSHYDVQTIREVVADSTEGWSRPTLDWERFELNQNALIFNRYYFNVPVSDLFPLMSIDGKLVIGCTFHGYGAHVPDALEEFDRFRVKYGVRRLPGFLDSRQR